MYTTSKKLVLILVTFGFRTKIGKEEETLIKVPSIHHLLHFKNNINNIKALFHLNNGLNAKTRVYTSKLVVHVGRTNMSAQKINISTFITFVIIVASLLVKDQQERS